MAASTHSLFSSIQSKWSFRAKATGTPPLLSKLSVASKTRYESVRVEALFVARASVSIADTNPNLIPSGLDQKITKSPIIVIDNYDSFTYNLCQKKTKTRNKNDTKRGLSDRMELLMHLGKQGCLLPSGIVGNEEINSSVYGRARLYL